MLCAPPSLRHEEGEMAEKWVAYDPLHRGWAVRELGPGYAIDHGVYRWRWVAWIVKVFA
jgi:hypothetical protein